MTIDSVAQRLKGERRDVPIQTSISATDSERLDALVAWLNDKGANTNRAGTIRAFVLDALDAFDEYRAEEDAKAAGAAE